jgi:hypothetical protein
MNLVVLELTGKDIEIPENPKKLFMEKSFQ